MRDADGNAISIHVWIDLHRVEMHWAPEPCTVPCPFPAGSAEKIEYMRWRVDSGEHLYHPKDSANLIRTAGKPKQQYHPGIRVISVDSLVRHLAQSID